MTRWRSHIAWLLCALLVFTAQSLVAARAAPAAVGQLVLCTSVGVVTVAVDADGNPVDTPPHLCPDCLLHHLGALAAELPAGATPVEKSGFLPILPTVLAATLQGPSPVARAPPRAV